MDNWEQQLINWFNETENNFYNFCKEIAQELEINAHEAENFIDNITQEIEVNLPHEINDVMTKVDDFIEECLTILIEEDPFDLLEYFLDGQPSSLNDHSDDSIIWFDQEQVIPTADFHPACINCDNYHGRKYNGNLLVCAMHPYGYDAPQCPDWQESPLHK